MPSSARLLPYIAVLLPSTLTLERVLQHSCAQRLLWTSTIPSILIMVHAVRRRLAALDIEAGLLLAGVM